VVGLSRIGTGGFAEVYRGVLGESGDPVAVKVFAPGTDARVEREAAALAEVGAPLVPRLLGREVTPEGRPALIMELVSGTSLSSASGPPEPGPVMTRRQAFVVTSIESVP